MVKPRIIVKNNVNRTISNAYWQETFAHLQPLDGQSMIEGDHIILPADEFDVEGVGFAGVRNLAIFKSISLLGGPTTFYAHKQDPAQPAHAAYHCDGKDFVIQFN